MGIVVEISSLEEMCDLMCNNQLPRPKKTKKKDKPERRNNDRKCNRQNTADSRADNQRC